ncbi:phosphatidylinositol N-acetylglucosaminyltransferase-domain-containing protein [Podospora australis]|uniref:Phosphatidylinositol N-acetylglucosaminyltransferase-domain-containing protein n=1 Tax=Podospora australis TaxID=1536484 RepID=A0AAN7AMP6_9PEZI|nr:phosphatidylinositol N-acetylglucosaminyltransferase-domain-containing protein [Podospora australis]
MAPPSGLHQSAIPSDFETPFPALVRSSTVPASLQSHRADPSHLAPEDAYTPLSPPRQQSGIFDSRGNGSGTDTRPRRLRRNNLSRSRSRRRKRFQKLLWVNQSYPDNYTDQATFLENLQRNPRVQPYDFWPLVADSTVILQHVCSVIIFIVCFVGIFQERVSPVSVVGWGSFATFLGWLLWDFWVSQEDQGGAGESGDRVRSIRGGRIFREYRPPRRQDSNSGPSQPLLATNISTASISSTSNLPSAASSTTNLLQEQPLHRPNPSSHPHSSTPSGSLLTPGHSHSRSVSSIHSVTSQTSANSPTSTTRLGPDDAEYAANGRAYLRVSTIKSAILIYFTLLGLSPILKSLTRSTSSDSIWAMSFWLLTINIFFFDYSGGWVGSHKKMPVAPLSTNAALMASTVLASRLPSTGQVFSLTLFSIEVFGLFPVFRQYARHRSWRYHVVLTVLLVLGAGGGVGMILGDGNGWPWKRGLAGMVVGCLLSALAMGGCSWWLIGLQKYKNEIYGPWDPARPIIISRRHWDDD